MSRKKASEVNFMMSVVLLPIMAWSSIFMGIKSHIARCTNSYKNGLMVSKLWLLRFKPLSAVRSASWNNISKPTLTRVMPFFYSHSIKHKESLSSSQQKTSQILSNSSRLQKESSLACSSRAPTSPNSLRTGTSSSTSANLG